MMRVVAFVKHVRHQRPPNLDLTLNDLDHLEPIKKIILNVFYTKYHFLSPTSRAV